MATFAQKTQCPATHANRPDKPTEEDKEATQNYPRNTRESRRTAPPLNRRIGPTKRSGSNARKHKPLAEGTRPPVGDVGAEHVSLGGLLVLRPLLVPTALAFLALIFGRRTPLALARRSFTDVFVVEQDGERQHGEKMSIP